jgi:hypothetical protein
MAEAAWELGVLTSVAKVLADTTDGLTGSALVQSLRTGPPHVAVVSGWAAIESLMVGPSDQQDVVAAHRPPRTALPLRRHRMETTQVACPVHVPA